MVLRAAIVHLLVAVLLACPYPCLMRAAASLAACAADDCAVDDDCCGSPGSETGDGHCGTPDCCPEGGTCLCHGAVISPHVAPPSLDLAIVTLLSLDGPTLVRETVAIDRGFGDEQAACHFAAVSSGRAVRALIASFLL
jgi:hypothetical protein